MPPIALITGVSRAEGLGHETARQLIDKNYRVIVSARDRAKAQALADGLGAEAIALDVTDPASVDAAAARLDAEHGRLDVLVNNAGAYFDMGAQPLDTDPEFAARALDTNLLGAWRTIRAFLPLLERGTLPCVVNVSSGAGSFADPVFGLGVHQGIVPAYGISKLALNGLTVKIARQLREAGSPVRVNAVCPGFVATWPGTAEWGARPVADGARGIVWAATLPADGPSGSFFRDGEPIPW